MAKYTFEGSVKELKLDDLKAFVTSYKEDKLKPFLKSADIPADNNEPVKILVGKNFE